MTAPGTGGPSGPGRSWLEHLRAGGTTPWSSWLRDRARVAGRPADADRVIIGAQQLELLRRLNLAAGAGGVPPGLVERVLGASAPGRGRPDLGLVGDVEPSRFGPRPVDPRELPLDELVRVAAGLLAEDLVARGADLPEPRVDRAGRYRDVPVAARRPLRWRTAYLLGGDPWLVDAARAHLVGIGRPPGGRDAVALLVGTDLAGLLVDTWTARCFGDGAPPWRQFLAELVDVGRLPPRADLVRAAQRWTGRLGRDRVQVVLDPALLPPLVGLGSARRGPLRRWATGRRRLLPTRPRLAAHATELARRTGPALSLLATPPRVAQLLTEVLLPRLATVVGDPLVVPAGRARWLRRQADRQRRGLVDGGWTVHGDLGRLLPAGHAGVAVPDEQLVLDLAVGLLLEAARGESASGAGGRGARRWRR